MDSVKEFEIFIITITSIIIGIAILLVILSGHCFNKYDVNNDGKVNAQDYVEIKNYIMEKEK
jgi:hypothetical protein